MRRICRVSMRSLSWRRIDMSIPDISVIVVTFNDDRNLANAVNSVLRQSHQNIEIIIIDDHSTDRTPEIAHEFCDQDNRVRYHRRAENSGAPGAPLNDGLDQARGKYLMFLGSDDNLINTACAVMLDEAEKTGAEIVSGKLMRVMRTENGRKIPWFPELHRNRRYANSINEFPEETWDTLTTNKIYRASFLNRIGARFPEGIVYEDVAFSAQTLSSARGISVIPDEIYLWNVYPPEERRSITNQRDIITNLQDRLTALKLAEGYYVDAGEDVIFEFQKKIVTHHLRFYLNDFPDATDDWCKAALAAMGPWIERVPVEVFRTGHLGDSILYAAALEGDTAAVRSILRGKQGGALSGRLYRENEAVVWAPRGRESRPQKSFLASELSDLSHRATEIKSHSEFAYLHLLERVEVSAGSVFLLGLSTDPFGAMGGSKSELFLRVQSASAGSTELTRLAVTETPEGIRWKVELPRRYWCTDSVLKNAKLTVQARSPSGEINYSVLQTSWNGLRSVEVLSSPRRHAYLEVEGKPRTAARISYQSDAAPRSMQVLVIGDVSWRKRYHLGDEAMTEVAITELQSRGIDVVLAAGDPDVSHQIYGVSTVPIFGFARQRSRAQRDSRLESILASERGAVVPDASDQAIINAVQSSDAVVIAGGGNLNSSGSHHIYERLAIKRLAERVGVPLFVSSQTVGPHLLSEDREMVRELAQYARVFGARESSTAALLREICDGAGTVVQTVDDALLLEKSDVMEAPDPGSQTTRPYVVGSFTYHAWSTGLSREQYYRSLGQILDDISEICDLDVFLLPHLGELGASNQHGMDNDVAGHDRIERYSLSGRVRSLPLCSAREVLRITSGAEFSISTRYHPLVFGAGLGIPAIGLITSYYSSLRMRGALESFGAEALAIPFEYWPVFGHKVLRELLSRRDEVAKHFKAAGREQRDYLTKWWDGIAAEILGTGDLFSADVVNFSTIELYPESDMDLLETSRVAQEGTNMYRMNNKFTVDEHAARLVALENHNQTLVTEIARLKAELENVRHRQRPLGADFRDRIQNKLRAVRGRKSRAR